MVQFQRSARRPTRSWGASASLGLLGLVLWAGCSAGPGVQTSAFDSSADVEASRAIQWTVTSPEHTAAFEQAYRLAAASLRELVAGREPGSWAVVLDADETVLNNAQYEVERVHAGAPFETEGWHAWCRRVEATALPGAVEYLDLIHQLGGRIAIVTNRRLEVHEVTAENLRKIGAPFDVLLTRTDEGDKAPRWRQVEEGTAAPDLGPLEIVQWVGDNIHDFPVVDAGMGALDLSPFGRRFIILPNPMYGSWQDNDLPAAASN